MNKKNANKNLTKRAVARCAVRKDAKAQSSYRYYCSKCGTVTYDESYLGTYCRECGAWVS